MKLKTFLYLFVTLISVQISAQCINDTNNIVTFTYNLSFYEIVKENKSWTSANNCAKSRGGHLAIIDSTEEQDTIFSVLNSAGINNSNTVASDGGGASYVWIAGTDSANEGSWVWDSIGNNNPQFWSGGQNGSIVGGRFNNWGNEPDNFQNQDGLGLALTDWPLGVAGEWNDIDLLNSLFYVIEYQLPTAVEKVAVNKRSRAFHIYPNPTENWLNLSCDCQFKRNSRFIIYNSSGAKVMHGRMNGEKINIQRLKSGIYWLHLQEHHVVLPLQKE